MSGKRLRKWRWVGLLLLVLVGAGAFLVDRVSLTYLTGQRRVPGHDFWGGEVRSGGSVPGFAFLGRTEPSENLPGVKILRPFESGSEIGLEPGDVILSVDGKRYQDGRELHQTLIRDYSAGDIVVLKVAREGEEPREIRLTLRPFIRTPADLNLPYRDVEIRSESGFTLRGWFIPPPGRSDGRAGVFIHGAKSSRFQALEQGAVYWHRRGYGLLTVDLSGRGTSEGDYVTYTMNERLDVQSLFGWLREQEDVSPEKVVAFGTSNGAAAAIYAAVEDEKLAGLVLDAPYSDLWTAAGEELSLRGISPLLRYPLALAVRLRAGVNLFSIRPSEEITKIRVPVLFIHGDADRRVLPYHSEIMAEARREAGLPTERWVLPGGEHGFDAYPPPGIFWSRVLDFFDSVLGGAPAELAL